MRPKRVFLLPPRTLFLWVTANQPTPPFLRSAPVVAEKFRLPASNPGRPPTRPEADPSSGRAFYRWARFVCFSSVCSGTDPTKENELDGVKWHNLSDWLKSHWSMLMGWKWSKITLLRNFFLDKVLPLWCINRVSQSLRSEWVWLRSLKNGKTTSAAATTAAAAIRTSCFAFFSRPSEFVQNGCFVRSPRQRKVRPSFSNQLIFAPKCFRICENSMESLNVSNCEWLWVTLFQLVSFICLNLLTFSPLNKHSRKKLNFPFRAVCSSKSC